ncbi:MAG TPA: SemiSWEET family transporter [Candidatus Methanoperedens sp.]|jgi:MtN3 and saliva related transmembrane protein
MDMGILWFLFGSMAAVLTTFGFVPQIIKMHRTRSSNDVSLATLYQFSAGVILWTFYGFHIGDIIVIVANIICFLTLVVAIGFYHYYALK